MTLKNISGLLICAIVVHGLFKEICLGEALVAASLCAVFALQLYLEDNKEESINDTLKKELADLRSDVSKLKIGRAFGK